MNRRRLLRLSGTALAAAVAGCGGGDDAETDRPADGGDATPSPSPTPAEEATTAAPTASSTTEAAPDADPTPTTADAGATPTASPDAATATDTPTPTATPTVTPRRAAQVVAVADGGLSFAPERFEIAAGETVVWVWHSSGHNVRAASRPRGADFDGTPGGDTQTYDEGHEFSYTFEVAGTYDYRCYPHRNVGMTGSFTVTE